MANRCDVAVVGLGLVGAAALRHLSATGQRCVGIGPAEPATGARTTVCSPVTTTPVVSPAGSTSGANGRSWPAGPSTRTRRSRPSRASPSTDPVGVLMADVDPDTCGGDHHRRRGPWRRVRTVRGGRAVWRRPCRRSRTARPCSASRRRAASSTRGACWPRSWPLPGEQGADSCDEQVRRRSTGAGRRMAWCTRSAGRTSRPTQVVIAAGPHADELAGLPRRPLIDVVAETVVLARVSAAEQQRLADLPVDHRRRPTTIISTSFRRRSTRTVTST